MSYSSITKTIIISVFTIVLFSSQLFAGPCLDAPVDKSPCLTSVGNTEKYITIPKSVVKNNFSIHALLTKRYYSRNSLFKKGIDNEPEGLENQFIKTFTKKVTKSGNWQYFNTSDQYCSNDIYLSEADQFAMYNGEMKNIDYIKRDIAIREAWSALGDVLKETPLGKEIIKLEDTISSFLTIEYSKGVSNDEAGFYLPGQMPVRKMKERKAFKISFSPIFYTDSESLNGNFSFELGLDCHNTLTETVYNIGTQELAFNLQNSSLNRYLGMKLSAYLVHNMYNETSALLKISVEY